MKKLLVVLVVVLTVFLTTVAVGQEGYSRGLRGEGFRGGFDGERSEITPEMKEKFYERRQEMMKRFSSKPKEEGRKVEGKREEAKKRLKGHRDRGPKNHGRQTRGCSFFRGKGRSRGCQCLMMGRSRGSRGHGSMMGRGRFGRGHAPVMGQRGGFKRGSRRSRK